MIELLTDPDTRQRDQAIQLASVEIDQPPGPNASLDSLRHMYTNLQDSELWVVLVDSAVRGMIAFRANPDTCTASIEVIASDPASRAD